MTKHAVLALSHAARFAGWDHGVRVTALCPGAVDTDFVAGIPGVTPAANRIAPETIAETVAFLLRLPNNASVAELVDQHAAGELRSSRGCRRPYSPCGPVADNPWTTVLRWAQAPGMTEE